MDANQETPTRVAQSTPPTDEKRQSETAAAPHAEVDAANEPALPKPAALDSTAFYPLVSILRSVIAAEGSQRTAEAEKTEREVESVQQLREVLTAFTQGQISMEAAAEMILACRGPKLDPVHSVFQSVAEADAAAKERLAALYLALEGPLLPVCRLGEKHADYPVWQKVFAALPAATRRGFIERGAPETESAAKFLINAHVPRTVITDLLIFARPMAEQYLATGEAGGFRDLGAFACEVGKLAMAADPPPPFAEMAALYLACHPASAAKLGQLIANRYPLEMKDLLLIQLRLFEPSTVESGTAGTEEAAKEKQVKRAAAMDYTREETLRCFLRLVDARTIAPDEAAPHLADLLDLSFRDHPKFFFAAALGLLHQARFGTDGTDRVVEYCVEKELAQKRPPLALALLIALNDSTIKKVKPLQTLLQRDLAPAALAHACRRLENQPLCTVLSDAGHHKVSGMGVFTWSRMLDSVDSALFNLCCSTNQRIALNAAALFSGAIACLDRKERSSLVETLARDLARRPGGMEAAAALAGVEEMKTGG